MIRKVVIIFYLYYHFLYSSYSKFGYYTPKVDGNGFHWLARPCGGGDISEVNEKFLNIKYPSVLRYVSN